MRKILNKKAQVTIFIIVAVLIVVAVGIYFLVRGSFDLGISKNLEPVYDYYLSCIEETAQQGASILGVQGGYIYVDEMDFVAGSQYRPFSSQLDFLGQPVPYWMYVSGNNLLKEQVPTETSMEEELSRFVEERIGYCDFSDFENQGYTILLNSEDVKVDVEINDLDIDVSVDSKLSIYFEEDSAIVNSQDVKINSKLGKFFNLALETYNYEKENMFLESYALDIMRLYAPVDGTEISCVPKIFVDEEIKNNLTEAISANVFALKLEGDYYELSDKKNNYFVTDIGTSVDENVNFVYMPDWPTRIDIYGDKVIKPIGLQEGLGILGFCYVQYHLVYDINFPVLIQFYDAGEIFQFPVAVIIEKNNAREALPSTSGVNIESEVCKYNNANVNVFTYDEDLNPVEARIQFKCLNDVCEIGETSLSGGEAVLNSQMPQCVNGFIVANAEGYAEEKYQISTNEENSANIILSKIYSINLDLGNVDKALVNFESEDYLATVLYPDNKEVELIEGYYNVSVYAYKNSSLTIPKVSKRECVEIPEEGILGLLGGETEKCYDIEIPSTKVEMAVVGGGKTQEYLTRGLLEASAELNINVPLFGTPSTLEELQNNYILAESELIYLEFE